MFEYIYLVASLIIAYINYQIAMKDYLNPSVVFCLMNFLSALVCSLVKGVFRVEIHEITFLVLISGMLIFTLFNICYAKRKWRKRRVGIKSKYYNTIKTNKDGMQYIRIDSSWIIAFILIEIIVSYYMIKYAVDVSKSINHAGSMGILSHLGSYNNIKKNFAEQLKSVHVHYSSIQKYGWPLSCTLGVLCFGILSNNYFVTKVFDKRLLAVSVLPIIMGFFLGSRSMSFRFITTYIIEFVFVNRYKVHSYIKNNKKLFKRLIIISILLVVFFVNIINIMGRTTTILWYEYISAYIGSPIFNLDHYLSTEHQVSDLFGKETFCYLYNYLGSLFGINEWGYQLNIPYVWTNGIYFGNVYTMYYMFIEDFGLFGVLPLTLVIAWYYNKTYYKIRRGMNMRKLTTLTLSFFIYSYLFNDLIMLTFSNRFYETVFSGRTLYTFIWMVLLWYGVKNGFFSKRIIFIRHNRWYKKKIIN